MAIFCASVHTVAIVCVTLLLYLIYKILGVGIQIHWRVSPIPLPSYILTLSRTMSDASSQHMYSYMHTYA